MIWKKTCGRRITFIYVLEVLNPSPPPPHIQGVIPLRGGGEGGQRGFSSIKPINDAECYEAKNINFGKY